MLEDNKKSCRFCGKVIDKDAIVCTKCGRQLELIGKEKIKVENVTKEFQHGKNNKFYTKNWFMWLMMVVYPPIGIFFMWKFHDKMKKNTKIILTSAFSLFFILVK